MTGALITVTTATVTTGQSGGAGTGVTVTPPYASGTQAGPGNITTNGVTVSATYGTAPYTYAWTLSGWTITNPTAASTAFTHYVPNGGQTNSTASCLITDSAAVTRTVYVDVSVQSSSTGQISAS